MPRHILTIVTLLTAILPGGVALAQAPQQSTLQPRQCYAKMTGGKPADSSMLLVIQGSTAHLYWERSSAPYEKTASGAPFDEVTKSMRDEGSHPITLSPDGQISFPNGHGTNYKVAINANNRITGINENKFGIRHIEGHC